MRQNINKLTKRNFNIRDLSVMGMLGNPVANVFVCAVVVLTALLFVNTSVHAAAGDSINSTATISYDLAGVPNTDSAVTSFTEDRIINFVVTESNGGLAVPVISDMTNAVMEFVVSNNSNSTFDFLVTSVNTSPNPFGLPADNFDPLPGTVQVFVESGLTPGYQDVQDTAVYIDELAANAQRVVYVVADMPTLAVDDVAAIALIAQVAQGGATGVEGVFINADDNNRVSPDSTLAGDFSNGATNVPAGTPNTIIDSPATMETVFLDPAGLNSEDLSTALIQDVAGNGQHADAGAFQAGTPVNIVKSVTVIDTLGGTDPHPGAVLRYQLLVNVSGNVAVDNLVISDAIPANTTYVDESIQLNGVAQTDEDNIVVDYSRANNAPVKPITSIEVDLSENGTTAVAPGTSNTIIFEVTID